MLGLTDRFRHLLFPVALFYWGLTVWRNLFYSIGFFVSHRLPIPVISVGNITMGGTGKTPMVVAIAQMLEEMGKRPAIISRGYKRETSGTVTVSDGDAVLVSWQEAGDEPFLMAKHLPSVPVIVDEVRYRGGVAAIEKFNPDVLILDDAFQHRAIERDLDIVLLNSREPPEHYKMIPYGRLREPVWALRRAHMVIWSRADHQRPAPPVRKWVRQHGVLSLKSGMTVRAVSLFEGKRVFAFCGIGDPGSFRTLLAQLNVEVLGLQAFPDHHVYQTHEVDRLVEERKAVGADHLVTTEKDWVKLPPQHKEGGFIRPIPMDMVFFNDDEKVLKRALGKLF